MTVRMAKTIDQANAAKAALDASKAAAMKILREQRGIQTEADADALLNHEDENVRAAALADITQLLSEVKITPEIVRAAQEADAILSEALVHGINFRDRQDARLVAEVPLAQRQFTQDAAAAKSVRDGVDPNVALVMQHPEAVNALPANDPAWNSILAGLVEQPAPPVPEDDVSRWPVEKCDAFLKHEFAPPEPVQTVIVSADGRTSSPLPGIAQMIRENEADDARRAKTAKPEADDFARFFPQGS